MIEWNLAHSEWEFSILPHSPSPPPQYIPYRPAKNRIRWIMLWIRIMLNGQDFRRMVKKIISATVKIFAGLADFIFEIFYIWNALKCILDNVVSNNLQRYMPVMPEYFTIPISLTINGENRPCWTSDQKNLVKYFSPTRPINCSIQLHLQTFAGRHFFHQVARQPIQKKTVNKSGACRSLGQNNHSTRLF